MQGRPWQSSLIAGLLTMHIPIVLIFPAAAVIMLLGHGSAASAGDKDSALQLVQQALKCKTGVTTRSTTRSADDIDWRGDFKKFSVFFQRTSSDVAPSSAVYEFRGGTYTSYLSLLTFTSAGKRLTVSCKKSACLTHDYSESGCDENGICGNVGTGSVRKEYVNSFFIELCDASAAKDAADGLRFIAQAN